MKTENTDMLYLNQTTHTHVTESVFILQVELNKCFKQSSFQMQKWL